MAPVWLTVPPNGYGGTERVVSLLAEGLVERGHDVTLFACGGSRTEARLVAPLTRAPRPEDPTAVADDVFHTVSAYLRAGEFDVVHDHSALGPALGAMLGGQPPVVVTLHGPWTPLGKRLLGLLHHRVHLVAISRAQQLANPGLRYAGVVHNGVDLRAHPLTTAKDDYLLFVGRISPEKRPEAAVEVARRAGMALKMVIKRAEPAERDYWEQAVAPLLTGEEEIFEDIADEQKTELYRRARVTLFPIDWPEPFGLVMIESMACGTPVVARRLGAAPEVIRDGVTGFLCDTLEEMVDAVGRAAKLSPAACRAHVEARFSAESMVAGYEALFATLARRAASPRG